MPFLRACSAVLRPRPTILRCARACTPPHLRACRNRATFRELLAEGDRDVVHGVLKWVLTQGQALEKRAFVGYHLTMPEVCGACVVCTLCRRVHVLSTPPR